MTFLLVLLAATAFAQDIGELSRQAAADLRSQRFAEAERAYRELARIEPANPMWRMNLGITLFSAGKHQASIPEFEYFLNQRPAPGGIHLMLGLARLKLSQYCPAIAPLEAAMKWDRQRTVVELADAYQGCKRYEQAARTYEAALANGHKTADVQRHAAYCFWRARLYADAKRHFQPLAAPSPTEAAFHYEYGDTLARLEGPEAGLPFLLKAVEIDPKLLQARAELGKALVDLARGAEAIPHLEASVEIDPALLLPLSRAYRAAGRKEDADRTQQEYRRRMQTTPTETRPKGSGR